MFLSATWPIFHLLINHLYVALMWRFVGLYDNRAVVAVEVTSFKLVYFQLEANSYFVVSSMKIALESPSKNNEH